MCILSYENSLLDSKIYSPLVHKKPKTPEVSYGTSGVLGFCTVILHV